MDPRIREDDSHKKGVLSSRRVVFLCTVTLAKAGVQAVKYRQVHGPLRTRG
jgi:hypothetical protein